MKREDLRIGDEISNQQIVALFAVGNMGGMRRSRLNNLLVLISDHTKGLYDDRWQGDVLLYTGMGKLDDQELRSQNRTVAESRSNGITMHLFEVTVPTRYRYSGIVELADEPFQESQRDESGVMRKVWIFPLRRIDEASPIFSSLEPKLEAAGEFDPTNINDAREKVIASIVRRRGQRTFRNALLAAYGGRCALTKCRVTELLDAAHIIPYMGKDTNHIHNGLLLRTDIHTLFDLGMIAIDTQSWKVLISKRLEKTQYKALSELKLRLPDDRATQPSKEALDIHRRESGL